MVTGPENSPYSGGQYHGHLIFPPDYPFRPPAVYMVTPNGRFKTNKRLCLSISDFHPDTWNPAWSVSTILVGLLSFMLEDDTPTLGSMESSLREKRNWATDSPLFNLKNDTFREIFPSLSQEMFARLSDAQKRRLKEDFLKRKVRLDVFPELHDLQVEDAAGAAAAASAGSAAGEEGSAGTGRACDRNNNREGGPENENAARSWTTILAVILGGLVLNYGLKYMKMNNFYD